MEVPSKTKEIKPYEAGEQNVDLGQGQYLDWGDRDYGEKGENGRWTETLYEGGQVVGFLFEHRVVVVGEGKVDLLRDRVRKIKGAIRENF